MATAARRLEAEQEQTVSGSTVTFKASLGMKITFALNIDGDSVSGKMKPGLLPATELTGHRIA